MKERINSLDMLKGLIMILMALDHFIYFINRFHPSEFWIVAPPVFPDPAYQIFRLLTHLCAPGFVLLAGTSLVLKVEGRLAGGAQMGRTRTALIFRGVVLILVVQFGLEQIAWLLGDLGGRGIALNANIYPGTPQWGGPYGYLGVIYALGLSIILGSLLCRAPKWILGIGAAISLAASPIALSFVQSAGARINPIAGALFVPGVSLFFTNYPLFPWFGVFLLGMLLGRLIAERGARVLGRIWVPAAVALVVGAAIRLIHPWGESHPFEPDRIGSFLELSKYPPSLAYLGITLGVLGLLLWGFTRLEQRPRFLLPGEILRTFGREPLVFYLLHLYVYGGLSLLLVLPPSPVLTLIGWLVSLALFWLILFWYQRLKGQRRQGNGRPIQT